MIAEGTTPTVVEVTALVKWIESNGTSSIMDPYVAEIDLERYDLLLSGHEAAL